ncbi:folylpolyglutamate synthase/dihydrofolate synthase [Longilinea arvoryzae]|uniref:Dihydrofolate synthase/folylpolyglutamate synthase n=1 Tax=Longilinea arvoryzae TaxID=360412 RepID=A0A0S7BHF6_9CHLR|nr:folylpolyglutamate synthase/dihydrofolate synthase family protein [Longilinea arvoryzae]GAP14592.1 folylpolyglutamate synthase/dihydrofolate synthase [Longilinea arvoryzae]
MTETDAAYQQALDYLYSFVDYSLTRNLRNLPEKFNLDRMRALMQRLGNPYQKYPVIHVAGTKGKGSTAAMIANALQAAGYRVGFYSSPHLIEFTERIQVNRQEISKDAVVDIAAQMKPYVAEIPQLTTFELTTAMGFIYFAQQKVDIAVVEVGLGGRLDATNIVTPLVSVITSISYDHMAVLGNTLAAIAGEKGGIIKPGRPVVIALQSEEARQVFFDLSIQRNAPLVEVGKDVTFTAGNHSLDGQSLRVTASDRPDHPLELNIPLLGQHQVENAATAYAALLVARKEGLNIPDDAIQRGFASVKWMGRFEILQKEPPVVLDSAHNQDSARRLVETLKTYFPGRRMVMVFGASEDKDISGMFTELMPVMDTLIATQSVHPRALDAGKLVEMAKPYGKAAYAILPLEEAVRIALEKAGSDGLVLVTGSLFVVAAARLTWQSITSK